MSSVNDRLRDVYHQLGGEPLPGGCDTCAAYQIMRPIVDSVWRLTTTHDADCPKWIEIQERTA